MRDIFNIETFQKKDGSVLTVIHDMFGRQQAFDSGKPYSLWKWWTRPEGLLIVRRYWRG